MASITYRLSPPKLRFHLTMMWTMIGCGILALALYALLIWRGGSPRDDPLFLLLVLLAPVFAVTDVHQLLSILPRRNFMTLDDAGLAYVRMGVRQRWSWHDLPAFSVTAPGNSARVIAFRPPAPRGLRSRLALWVLWYAEGYFAGGHRVIWLSDQYDTPLDEIAAALNEHRERALAG